MIMDPKHCMKQWGQQSQNCTIPMQVLLSVPEWKTGIMTVGSKLQKVPVAGIDRIRPLVHSESCHQKLKKVTCIGGYKCI